MFGSAFCCSSQISLPGGRCAHSPQTATRGALFTVARFGRPWARYAKPWARGLGGLARYALTSS